jgi:hypothetical protein
MDLLLLYDVERKTTAAKATRQWSKSGASLTLPVAEVTLIKAMRSLNLHHGHHHHHHAQSVLAAVSGVSK